MECYSLKNNSYNDYIATLNNMLCNKGKEAVKKLNVFISCEGDPNMPPKICHLV